MANVCNMCGKSVREPLSTAGLCRACSESMRTGEPSAVTNVQTAHTFGDEPLPQATPQRTFRWGYYLLGLFLLALGLLLIGTAAFDSSPRGPITGGTRGGRALGEFLRAVFGARGEEAVLGIAALAGAFGLAYWSTRWCRWAVKLLAFGAMIVPTSVVLCAGLAVGYQTSREMSWRRSAAKELRPLLDGHKESKNVMPEIRAKVVIWDHMAKTQSTAQALLPAERQGSSADAEMTFVLIFDHIDRDEKPFNDGTRAVQRTLKIGVINWPERKVLSVHSIEGEGPPLITMRPAGDRGPVIGNTDEPLKRWIMETVPRYHAAVRDQKALQGVWQSIPSDEPGAIGVVPHTLKFVDKSFVKGDDKGDFAVIDALAVPRQIDFHTPKTVSLAIYALEGDTLKIREGPPGQFERPSDFVSADGSRLSVYKRK